MGLPRIALVLQVPGAPCRTWALDSGSAGRQCYAMRVGVGVAVCRQEMTLYIRTIARIIGTQCTPAINSECRARCFQSNALLIISSALIGVLPCSVGALFA